jgi:hypothetical protein
MIAIIQNERIYVDANKLGGILKDMYHDGYNELKLDLNLAEFRLFLIINNIDKLSIENLLKVYKIAHYLNAEERMKLFGKEISQRIQKSTYDEIKKIIDMYDSL